MIAKTFYQNQTRVKAWFWILVIATLNSAMLHSQANRVYSEAPVIVENGVKLSTQITVNFNERVFDLAPGRIEAAIADMAPAYPNVKKVCQDLERRYGKIVFRKQIPDAVWGDVWRTNIVTGELVRIHEWSQLFYMAFDHLVPIDSIMNIIKALPEVVASTPTRPCFSLMLIKTNPFLQPLRRKTTAGAW